MIELLALVVLLGLVAVPLGVVWLGREAKKTTEKAREDAPNLLDGIFTGEPTVVHEASNLAGLSVKELVAGGAERGYRLTSQSQGRWSTTLAFEKAD